MANKNLTIEDRDCYSLMPDGWFNVSRLPYPRIQRAEYRCNRLKELGLLESRVVGETIMSLTTEYRKLPQSQQVTPQPAPADGAKEKSEWVIIPNGQQ